MASEPPQCYRHSPHTLLFGLSLFVGASVHAGLEQLFLALILVVELVFKLLIRAPGIPRPVIPRPLSRFQCFWRLIIVIHRSFGHFDPDCKLLQWDGIEGDPLPVFQVLMDNLTT